MPIAIEAEIRHGQVDIAHQAYIALDISAYRELIVKACRIAVNINCNVDGNSLARRYGYGSGLGDIHVVGDVIGAIGHIVTRLSGE